MCREEAPSKNLRSNQELRVMDKKGKQSELIGRIILADFLEYRLKKFIHFDQAREVLPLYKKLTHEGIIIRKSLSIDDFRLTPALARLG